MKNNMASVLKWAWLAAVCLFIVLFVQRNFSELEGAIKQIHICYLLLSFLCIAAGKVLLALFMRFAVRSVGEEMDFFTCFRIYNISQLGKYIPGNIWHFVGKAAAYKDSGFSMGKIRDALVAENIWLVGSAFVYGLILIFILNFSLIEQLFSSYSLYLAVFFAVAAVLIFLGHKVLKIPYWQIFSKPGLNVKIILLQLAIWTLLGLGFALLAVPFIGPDTSALLMITGLYALAYSIGFVTPFAPAGIGVREAVLAVGLLPWLPLEVVITLSAANRVLYLFVEIALAALSRAVDAA